MVFSKTSKTFLSLFFVTIFATQTMVSVNNYQPFDRSSEQISASSNRMKTIKEAVKKTAKKVFEIGGYVAFNYFIHIFFGTYFRIFAHECGHAIAAIPLLGGFKKFFVGSEKSPKLIDFTPSKFSFLGRLGVEKIGISKPSYPSIVSGGAVHHLNGFFDLSRFKKAFIYGAGFLGELPALLFLLYLNVGRSFKKMFSPFSSLVEDETLCGYQFITKLVVSFAHSTRLIRSFFYSFFPLVLRGGDGTCLIYQLFGLKAVIFLASLTGPAMLIALRVLVYKFLGCLIKWLAQRNIIRKTGVPRELIEATEGLEFMEKRLLNFGRKTIGGTWRFVKNVGSSVASTVSNTVGGVVRGVENKIGCRPMSTIASTISRATEYCY